MNKYIKLKNRIKRNEGYSNKAYFDQLGNPTIGYGHLIKKSDKLLFKKKYSKKYLNHLFNKDFNKSLCDFKRHYNKIKLPKGLQEVLIEMIFQLGIKRLLEFKRFNKFIKQRLLYLAALEMIDSNWYFQTPKRVDGLINVVLGFDNDK